MTKVHSKYYESGAIQDTKHIIPTLKTSLKDSILHFSSLFPQNTISKNADICNIAISFGATIKDTFDSTVTHVVAGRISDKCVEARGKCNIVWGQFVWDSCFRFQKQNQQDYAIFNDLKLNNNESIDTNLKVTESTGIDIGHIGVEDWDDINKELQEFEDEEDDDENTDKDFDYSGSQKEIDTFIPSDTTLEEDWIKSLEDSFTDSPITKRARIN